MKNIIFTLLTLCFCSFSYAQVTGVSYSIDFDYQVGDTLFYDCSVRINSGSTTAISSSRIQFNSQFTVVALQSTEVKVVESYMPLSNNAIFLGTEPIEWRRQLTSYGSPMLISVTIP